MTQSSVFFLNRLLESRRMTSQLVSLVSALRSLQFHLLAKVFDEENMDLCTFQKILYKKFVQFRFRKIYFGFFENSCCLNNLSLRENFL
jgi:hypothetical protein